MNELTRKKISRTAIRKHCKKLESDIDELLVNFPIDGVTKLKAFKLNYEAQVKRVHDVDEFIRPLTVRVGALKVGILLALICLKQVGQGAGFSLAIVDGTWRQSAGEELKARTVGQRENQITQRLGAKGEGDLFVATTTT